MSLNIDSLNPPQKEAALHNEGPLLLLAGAGSGKTRVLTYRIAHLLTQGVRPWQIMAVTFTNKAANEMKQRVFELVEDQGREVLVSTFHSACVRFLRRDIEALGMPRTFTIYDTDDQRRLMKQIIKDRGVDIKTWSPRKVLSKIDRAKNRLQSPDDMETERRGPAGDPTSMLYRDYQHQLRKANAVDFNDLLGLVVRLWRENPDVLQRYQERYRYLMVDEYQDTNRAQYELIRLLAGQAHNIAVVGDDDQSIYGFRGADIRNILDFEKDFPATKIIRLEQNYRSTGNIIRAAAGVVRNNKSRMPKELWTSAEPGEKVKVLVGEDEQQEAARVVGEISRGVRKGRSHADYAVIYRTNAASRAIEQALAQKQIPYLLVGARKFFERREVRDLVAYLKMVLNPADDMAFTRVVNAPRRGVGAKAMDGIRAQASMDGVPLLAAARVWCQGKGRGRKGVAQFVELIDRAVGEVPQLEPGEFVAWLVNESGYAGELSAEGTHESQGRLENLEELARAAQLEPLDLDEEGVEVDTSPLDRLQAFIDRVSLVGQADELPEGETGRVTLLTAHLAKGLEFPVVFVIGMTEGGFPHFLARERLEDVEEERRLVYVAITRAMSELVLTRSRRRFIPGQGFGATEPSRFLSEIPSEVVDWGANSGRRQRFGGGESREARLARLGFATGSPPQPPKSVQVDKPPPSLPTDGPVTTRIPESAEEFQPGTQILHPSFGFGVIQRCEGSQGNLKLSIAFEEHGRKRVYARFAQLEIVSS